MDFQNLQKSNFPRGKILKVRSSIKLSWGHVRSHAKFGPDRFSRLDEYWTQTDRQSDRQTSKVYIYRCVYLDVISMKC